MNPELLEKKLQDLKDASDELNNNVQLLVGLVVKLTNRIQALEDRLGE